MKNLILTIFCVFCLTNSAMAKTYLFILAGQSNMNHVDPELFTQKAKAAFPNDEIIVVKDSQSGRPIMMWYKEWKALDGREIKNRDLKRRGKLYERLMGKVKPAIKDKKLDSVTLVWMQGEADAKANGKEYEGAIKGLMEQLKTDLKKPEINFVLGRISDYGLKDKTRPQWNLIRETQVKVAEADPRGEWIDTDDLNGKANGLHYDKPGYKKLTERFAEKAIKLVKENDLK